MIRCVGPAGLVFLAMLLPSPAGAQTDARSDPFEHAKHEGLFPLCTGCHEAANGVGAAVAALHPPADGCVGCHDGVDLEQVPWDGPTPAPGHLLYDHAEHRALVLADGDDPPECSACHAPSAEERWEVVRVRADGCWTCHETEDHYQTGPCASCHTPLAASTLTESAVATWEPSRDHESEDFLSVHGSALDPGSDLSDGCATCHTRDQCLDCHVSAGPAPIQALEPAPTALASLELPARYPVPDDHEALDWLEDHGRDFEAAECSTCHTRDDCTGCHVQPGPADLGELIPRSRTRAPGAELLRTAPATHRRPAFPVRHGDLAAAAASSCETCHVPAACVSCHVGGADPTAPAPALPPAPKSGPVTATARHAVPGGTPLEQNAEKGLPASGGFHPSSFVLRHSTDAWNGLLECSNCHNTQVFCRSCHVESGLASSGRLGPGYHDAQPLWLLRHGQSARQALESCASCHRQQECLQCHSTIGAFRVNPHGSSFDPDDVRERAERTCFACHLGGPPPGGSP